MRKLVRESITTNNNDIAGNLLGYYIKNNLDMSSVDITKLAKLLNSNTNIKNESVNYLNKIGQKFLYKGINNLDYNDFVKRDKTFESAISSFTINEDIAEEFASGGYLLKVPISEAKKYILCVNKVAVDYLSITDHEEQGIIDTYLEEQDEVLLKTPFNFDKYLIEIEDEDEDLSMEHQKRERWWKWQKTTASPYIAEYGDGIDDYSEWSKITTYRGEIKKKYNIPTHEVDMKSKDFYKLQYEMNKKYPKYFEDPSKPEFKKYYMDYDMEFNNYFN